jgi:hypothetical protein
MALALFYAPLAYGCTRPEMLPPLFGLLAGSIILGGFSLWVNRDPSALPRLMLLCVAMILLQGWWVVWDPVFRVVQLMSDDAGDATFANIRLLSFNSMVATTFLLGSFAVLCAIFAHPDVRRFLLLSTAISGVVISVIGIFLKVAGNPVMAYFWAPSDMDWNDFAFYRYHGNAGAFLNLVWPLILVFTRRAYSPTVGHFKRILWTFAALTCGTALLVNASKASLIIGLLILPWPFSTLLMNLSIKTRILLVVGTLCFIAAGTYGLSKFTDQVAFTRIIQGDQVEASAGGRLKAYQEYINTLPDVGVFGVGPGLFQLAFPYQDSPLGNVRTGLREYAHEDYLQTMIEWGWWGSLWWFLLLAGGLYRAFRSYAQRELFSSRTDRHLVLAAILGVLGTLCQSFVDFPLQIASIRLFFLVLLALCWASPLLLEPPRSRTLHRHPAHKPIKDAVSSAS